MDKVETNKILYRFLMEKSIPFCQNTAPPHKKVACSGAKIRFF